MLTLLFTCSDDEGNLCQYQPTLTTLEVDEITEFTATLNGLVSVVSQNCDDPINTEQGFVYSTEIQPTINNSQVNVNGVEISVTLENLEPNTTYYARVFLTNALGEFDASCIASMVNVPVTSTSHALGNIFSLIILIVVHTLHP